MHAHLRNMGHLRHHRDCRPSIDMLADVSWALYKKRVSEFLGLLGGLKGEIAIPKSHPNDAVEDRMRSNERGADPVFALLAPFLPFFLAIFGQ